MDDRADATARLHAGRFYSAPRVCLFLFLCGTGLLNPLTSLSLQPPAMSSPLLDSKRESVSKLDIEKDTQSVLNGGETEFYVSNSFMKKLSSWGVEARGTSRSIDQQRMTGTSLPQESCPYRESREQIPSTTGSSSSGCLLTSTSYRASPPLSFRASAYPRHTRFSAGSLGPAVFGLGLRDSCLVILFFNLLASLLPAYLYALLPLR